MGDHLVFLVGDHFFCWSNTSYPSYLKKLLVVVLLIFRYADWRCSNTLVTSFSQ
jgi:hypothetical protein